MTTSTERAILVTGGAGYIGSHACKALKRSGYTPITYDNMVFGHDWAVKWGPLEVGDVLDRARLDEVFTRYRPAAVMHFAAFAFVGESNENPGKYYRNNVGGSLTLLEAMRDHGVANFVFSSTCATYGVPDEIPITETQAQAPINPYGSTKLMVEQILRDFDTAHGIKSCALRYFNAAGADPDNEIGEAHDPETHLIPLVLDAASGKRSNVAVFGTDYDTRDGTCIRDYVHVTDLADAHVLALQALESGAASSVYNLGNGTGFSVQEVIESVGRVTGKEVPVVFTDRRPGDPPALVGDAARACAELGWKPQLFEIDRIVATAWAWHQRAVPD